MANTLSASVNLVATIAGQSFPFSSTVNTTPAGSGAVKETLSIATTATQIPLTGITQAGFVVIQNLDSTNTIHVSFESTATTTPQVVQPGGFLVLSPSSGGVVYAIAQTAAVQIAYTAISI